MKDKNYLNKIEEKIENLESKLKGLKSSLSNVGRKANRIVEDDLMSLEQFKRELSNNVKEYEDDNEESVANLENSMSLYEKKLYSVLDKYKQNTTKG